MPKSVNQVILIGNLEQDPDIKYTPSGTAVAKFSLATNERFKRQKASGRSARSGTALWPGSLAEIVGEYLRKGSKAYIERRL